MKQIVVFHEESSSTLTLQYDVYPIASSATLIATGPGGEFKSRHLRLDGHPSKALMDNVVNSLFELAKPGAKAVVGEEFWDELEEEFFNKYNAMTF